MREIFGVGKRSLAAAGALLLLLCGSVCSADVLKLETDFQEARQVGELIRLGRYSESKKLLEKLAGSGNPWALYTIAGRVAAPGEGAKLRERAVALGHPQHPKKEEAIRRWKEILERGRDPLFRASACRALAILERDKMGAYCDRGVEILNEAPEAADVLWLRDALRRRFDVTPGRPPHPDQLRLCELSPGLIANYVNLWMGTYDGKTYGRRPLKPREAELLRKHEAFLRRTVADGETGGFFSLGRLLAGFCDYPDRRIEEGLRYLERAAVEQNNVQAGILLARFYSGTLDSPRINTAFSPVPPEMLDSEKAEHWIRWCAEHHVSASWLRSLKDGSGKKPVPQKTRR